MHFFVLLFSLLLSVVSAHNELIKPKGRACYYEELRVGDTFGVSFQVGTRDSQSSEQHEIDFWINNPSGHRVYQVNRATDGKADVDVKLQGRYEFCFSNEYSSDASKDVTFHVNHVWASKLRNERYDTLEGQIKLLSRLVHEVQQEQSYVVIRERVHRNTAESTNDRVKWWSILQFAVVVASSVFQVFYLKRFFEVRSTV